MLADQFFHDDSWTSEQLTLPKGQCPWHNKRGIELITVDQAWPHRTKIVATLGPATDRPGVLAACIRAGLDIARLNAAHGSPLDLRRRAQALRQAAARQRESVGLLVDLPGPKFRLGSLPPEGVTLRAGAVVTLTSSQGSSESNLPVRTPSLLRAIAPGHRVFLADGTATLQALERSSSGVRCRVLVGGSLRSGSGINLPDTDIPIRWPTPEDRQGIHLAITQKAEWLGISFVRTAREVTQVRALLRRAAHRPALIAKIEKPQALLHLDEILKEADGVMVARGDLGVETPLAGVPLVQKRIIARANFWGKPVITATQMLESMVTHPWPTRAEVSDVANAALDGTDAVMLSAETAIGRYPVEAVRLLGSVLSATEAVYPFRSVLEARARESWSSPEDALSLAACRLAWDINAKAIVLISPSKTLPARVSRFRPPWPIVALTPDSHRVCQWALSWGVRPLHHRGSGDPFLQARRWLRQEGLARSGDSVVLISSASGSYAPGAETIRHLSL